MSYQQKGAPPMSATAKNTADTKRAPRKTPKKKTLSRTDALGIGKAWLMECQASGIVVKLANHQRGVYLLLEDVAFENGAFVALPRPAPHLATDAATDATDTTT